VSVEAGEDGGDEDPDGDAGGEKFAGGGEAVGGRGGSRLEDAGDGGVGGGDGEAGRAGGQATEEMDVAGDEGGFCEDVDFEPPVVGEDSRLAAVIR
jgi:hypothetical protein